MTELSLLIRSELPQDNESIERLHERAFGPGRFARTAFRLREKSGHLMEMSFTALVGTLLVGSVRMGSVLAGSVPALILGPIAVEPAFEGRGIGGALIRAAIAAAKASARPLVILVGDEPYYGRFGFRRIPPGQLELPGPVDPIRCLALELEEGALARAKGAVRTDRP